MLAFRPRGSGRSALVCRLFRGGSGLLAQLLGIAGAPDGTTVAPQGACARSFANDTWITTKAKIALLTADDVSATAVKVDTQKGNVVIHGKVKSEAEKAKAEQVVKSIEGVQTVKNLLQVVAPSQKDAVDAS